MVQQVKPENKVYFFDMSNHRYRLQPYRGMTTRYRCPGCQHRDKTFVRYIETETGEVLHPDVGRCNREDNCGYHYTPKQFFEDNPGATAENAKPRFSKPMPRPQIRPVSFIPDELFMASLKAFEANYFVKFLIDKFGSEVAEQAVGRYFIGSSKHWQGATIFWQIDQRWKVRTGKIMLYSPTTGKRVKEPTNHIDWVHSVLRMPEFELKQCLFGEHLLNDVSKPVAIVESEKTAVIASVYLPEFIWLAAGNKQGLTFEKCSVLKGRTVRLYPDLKAFDDWSNKAKLFASLAEFSVSDLLENKATEAEKTNGLDLADYLLRFNPEDFKLPEISQPPTRQKTADAPNPKAAPPQVEKAAAAPAEPPQPPTATAEDITFSRMAEKCPKLKQFAERFDLISTATGKPFQIIPIEQPTQPEDIAHRILQPRNSYTAVEIAHMMEKALKMPPDTAATGVKKLISAGAIEHSGNQRFHLKDSTPF
jgi:hypothetical protein